MRVAAEYFKEKGVQALFLPFCNFGQEEAAAKLASELKVPVLLWGPKRSKAGWRKGGNAPDRYAVWTICGKQSAEKDME